MFSIKRFSAPLWAAILFFSCIFSASASDVPPAWDGYIVKLHDDVPAINTFSQTTDPISNLWVVNSLDEAAQIPDTYVEYIEPNYLVELFSVEEDVSDGPVFPSDPYYRDYQWSLQEINALSAYQKGLTGDGVRIGFIDSGINSAHEDLDSSRISGTNFNSDGLPYNRDDYGHGTFATGIVSAQTDNGIGLSGIAPKAEIKAYRVFSSKTTTISAIVSAIDQAIADNCDVLNLSLGTPTASKTLEAAINRASEAGIILVAAVGNSGSTILQYPAAYPAVIGVGSVNKGSILSSFSQRNSSVYVTAPGGGIAGLDYLSENGYLLSLSNASNRGTSFSAPVIAGMAALALEYDSDITAEGFRYLLKTTSTDQGDPGYDTSYGYGVVNIASFVTELTRDYTLQFNLNGGAFSEPSPSFYRVKDDTLPLPTPIRDGYDFLGWYTDSDFSGSPVKEISAGSLGDRIFFAKWKIDASLSIQSISVSGYTAYEDGTERYSVCIPTVTELTADRIIISPYLDNAIISPPVSSDDGATWTFSVSSGTHTVKYELHVHRAPTSEIGSIVMDSIQIAVSEDQLTLEIVPEDIMVIIAAYQDEKLLFLRLSTAGTTNTRSFTLPAGTPFDSIRLFSFFDWKPIACQRQIAEFSRSAPPTLSPL